MQKNVVVSVFDYDMQFFFNRCGVGCFMVFAGGPEGKGKKIIRQPWPAATPQ